MTVSYIKTDRFIHKGKALLSLSECCYMLIILNGLEHTNYCLTPIKWWSTNFIPYLLNFWEALYLSTIMEIVIVVNDGEKYLASSLH